MKLERKEREGKRKNIIIKGIKNVKEVKKEVEEVLRAIEVTVEIEEIRETGRKIAREGEKKMVVVKLKNMKDKIKIITKKKGLKGREERIEDDLETDNLADSRRDTW